MAERYENKKDFLERRRAALKTERDSFVPHWKELSEFIQPRRGRFFISDVNKGDRRHKSIINSAATTAHRRCRSGIMSGLMLPSRPWFKMEPGDDPGLMEFGPVQTWLHGVEGLLNRIFRQSNLYQMTSVMVGEEILFGTGCMTHVDDFKDVARFYTHTIGTYMIDLDERLEVNTLVREFEWTVGQIVADYGYKKCSPTIRNQYDQGNYGTRYPIVHFVAPNPEFKAGSFYAKDKPFLSCHYEQGAAQKDLYLRESGFEEFPAYCPRWDVTGEDVYATDCPGMTALGDTKGLQIKEKRKAQGIDKIVSPPLKGPASLRQVAVSALPGALTAYEGDSSREGLSPIYQVSLPVGEMRVDIAADEQRIKEAFYNDLFRAISDLEGVQPQNELFLTQVNQERLLELGPMMERFQGEFQNKLIDRTFNQCVRAGILPEPPEEMKGRPLKVDYIGPMAMAARAAATNSIDRVAGFAGNLMKMGFEDVRYKFNAMQSVDEYAKALGAPPGIIVPDDEAAEAMQAAQEQQQAAMAAEAAPMVTQSVKNLADAGASAQQAAQPPR